MPGLTGDDSRAARTSLIPPIVGLALSSAVFALTIQNGYRPTATPALENATLVVACALGAILLAVSSTGRLNKRFISLSTFLAIHVSGIAALVLTFFDATGAELPGFLQLPLEALATVGAAILSFYWLRKLRGTSSAAVGVIALAALALGEILVLACSWSDALCHGGAFVCSFTQFAAVRWSRSLQVPSDYYPAIAEAYLGQDEHRFSSRTFLAAATLGICCIAVPFGMVWGYPTGAPAALDLPGRTGVAVLTVLLAVLGVRSILAEPERSRTTGIWLTMVALFAAATILSAAGVAGAGGALAIVSILALRAFVWYLSAAFISFGTRDPYFYTTISWVVMNVLVVCGTALDAGINRIAPGNTALMVAVMAAFALAATHLMLTQLLVDESSAAPAANPEAAAGETSAEHASATATPGATAEAAAGTPTAPHAPITQDDIRRIPLMGVLAIPPEDKSTLPSSTPDVHIATSVLAMGQRFGLTGREVEVLTLYALGHTQARVSEELSLSTNTVHTHIKRIYDKTDLHSRQEILDYIAKYGGA